MVGDNVEIGIYPLQKALEIAKSLDTDLVEISPKANPPVCKALDYKKFLYDQKKREKYLKAKTQKVVVKEIRFGPQTRFLLPSFVKTMLSKAIIYEFHQ